jgi:hypothetical protein
MKRWSSGFLRVILALVVVLLAGDANVSVRAAFHPQSARITGITFIVDVVGLVLAFERIFPSIYSGSAGRSVAWWQTRLGFAVIFGIILSTLSSRIATIWFGLVINGRRTRRSFVSSDQEG